MRDVKVGDVLLRTSNKKIMQAFVVCFTNKTSCHCGVLPDIRSSNWRAIDTNRYRAIRRLRTCRYTNIDPTEDSIVHIPLQGGSKVSALPPTCFYLTELNTVEEVSVKTDRFEISLSNGIHVPWSAVGVCLFTSQKDAAVMQQFITTMLKWGVH